MARYEVSQEGMFTFWIVDTANRRKIVSEYATQGKAIQECIRLNDTQNVLDGDEVVGRYNFFADAEASATARTAADDAPHVAVWDAPTQTFLVVRRAAK